jgi:hypothetical protein
MRARWSILVGTLAACGGASERADQLPTRVAQGGASAVGAGGDAGSRAGTGGAGASSTGGAGIGVGGQENGESVCPALAKPPGPTSDGASADAPASVVHAVRRWYLGETDFDGIERADAWKAFGFDVDGAAFPTSSAPGHCIPVAGAKKSAVIPDGPCGLDNSFGKNLLPIWQGFVDRPSRVVTESALAGRETLLLDFGRVGSQSDYRGLVGQSFWARGNFEGKSPIAPTEDEWEVGTYAWHPRGWLTVDPKAAAESVLSKEPMIGSYVAGNTWVSGGEGVIEITPTVSGFGLPLRIHRAVISARLAPDRRTVTHGTIAGVLLAEDIMKGLAIAAAQEYWACEGSYEGIAGQIRQAADVLSDGTQDPTRECDAISIGIGFDSSVALLGAPIDEEAAWACSGM